MKYVMIIGTEQGPNNALKKSQGAGIYIMSGTFNEAVQNLHRHLYKKAPKIWSNNWQDLKNDFKEGNQLSFKCKEFVINES